MPRPIYQDSLSVYIRKTPSSYTHSPVLHADPLVLHADSLVLYGVNPGENLGQSRQGPILTASKAQSNNTTMKRGLLLPHLSTIRLQSSAHANAKLGFTLCANHAAFTPGFYGWRNGRNPILSSSLFSLCPFPFSPSLFPFPFPLPLPSSSPFRHITMFTKSKVYKLCLDWIFPSALRPFLLSPIHISQTHPPG
jgi:hypothetical protein